MADHQRELGLKLNIKYNEQGLVPAIVQDVDTGDILMMGWMNALAVKQTLQLKKATFYSRSRNKMWVKGESSGNTQDVVEFLVDCDQDTIILKCKSNGPCCHVGYNSCFYRASDPQENMTFIAEKVYNPEDVYKK